MKGITVKVKVERYIKEWLEFHYGNPVRFPKRSGENAILLRALSKRPHNVPPDITRDESCVSIEIPNDDKVRPEYYNYLPTRGKRMICKAIDALFRAQLWTECLPFVQQGGLNEAIIVWCRHNGISLDASEAVRQKFYRMRKSHHMAGVIIGKKRKKKSRDSVKKRT